MEVFQSLEKRTFYLTKVMLLPVMVPNVGAEGIIFSLVHSLSGVFWNTREKPQLAYSPNGGKNTSGTWFLCVLTHVRVKATARFRIRTEFSSGRENLSFVCLF